MSHLHPDYVHSPHDFRVPDSCSSCPLHPADPSPPRCERAGTRRNPLDGSAQQRAAAGVGCQPERPPRSRQQGRYACEAAYPHQGAVVRTGERTLTALCANNDAKYTLRYAEMNQTTPSFPPPSALHRYTVQSNKSGYLIREISLCLPPPDSERRHRPLPAGIGWVEAQRRGWGPRPNAVLGLGWIPGLTVLLRSQVPATLQICVKCIFECFRALSLDSLYQRMKCE